MCYELPGYKFDRNVSNTLTVHIPAANQGHVGHYFCDVFPTRIGVARPVCNITVIGTLLPGREKEGDGESETDRLTQADRWTDIQRCCGEQAKTRI